MGNLVVAKICPKCHALGDSSYIRCIACNEEFKPCVVKILTIDNVPVAENPEPEGRLIRYWTIEEIREKVKYAIDKGIGRVRCTCGHDLRANQLKHYPHEGGIPIVAKGRQWIYIHCQHCHYDWALWKLGYGIDTEREKVPT